MLGSIIYFALHVLMFSVAFFVIFDIVKKRHILRFSRKIKGYTFYPIIGNGYHFFGKDMLTCLQDLVKDNGLPCNIWAGHDYIYATADASEIKVVLNHPYSRERSVTYKYFRRLFAGTLLLQKWNEWKRDRRILSKNFNQRALNNLVTLFDTKSNGLIENLRNHKGNISVGIFQLFTFDIISDSLTGSHEQFSQEDNLKFFNNLQNIQNIIGKRLFTTYFFPENVFLLTPEGRKVLKGLSEIKKRVNKVIQYKRKKITKIKECSQEDEDILPLIDLMLRNEHKFSEEDISQHLILFILAAIDTSATTLFFTFILLGMHPEIQEKVYQEIVQTVGVANPITHNDLPKLKYTEMVINEAMRILPAVPIIGRSITSDLNLGTRTIPAGSNVLISIFNTHRNEKYWKNPLKYDPDRFLPEEVAKRDPYAFIPFSGGPRNCIGMKYGEMVVKTALMNVIRNFKAVSGYKSIEEIKLISCVTLAPIHELDCQLISRGN